MVLRLLGMAPLQLPHHIGHTLGHPHMIPHLMDGRIRLGQLPTSTEILGRQMVNLLTEDILDTVHNLYTQLGGCTLQTQQERQMLESYHPVVLLSIPSPSA